MAENLDVLNTAVSPLIRAALPAARFSGRVRQRYLKRLASPPVLHQPLPEGALRPIWVAPKRSHP